MKKEVTTWIRRTALKTVKTMAQTAVGIISGCSLLGEVDFGVVLSSSIISGLVCILMNIQDFPEAESD